MGLFDGLKKIGQAIGNGIKKVYNGVKNFFSSNDNTPKITGGDPEAEKEIREAEAKAAKERRRRERLEREEEERLFRQQEKIRNDDEQKSKLKRRATRIHEYQEKVAVQAEEYETTVQRLYSKTYSGFVNELEQYMDVRPIRKFIDGKMKVFENMMRDEVLEKISLQNMQLNDLMDDLESPFEEYCKKIDDYANRVYLTARENLLKNLKKVIEETNNHIKVYANKYIIDITQEAKEHKESLDNLSQEGEVRDAQLLKIASEYSTLLIIKSLAEQEINK
jgi:hypothetical protein